MAGPLDSLRVMQRRACLWITGSFKTSPRGAAETLAGILLIHLHVQKLVERSHVHTRSLQATHAFRRLVDGDHKYSVKSLQHQIKGNLVSPITEAWRNLGISSVNLDPVHRFAQPGIRPKDLFPGRIVLDIVKPRLSESGRRVTCTPTGELPVSPRQMTPNCKQLQPASIRRMTLVSRTYVKCTCSQTPQTRSVFVWTRLITLANPPPLLFVGCSCHGSSNMQITLSTFTTSPLVWSWKTTSLCTSTPPRLASRRVVSPLSLPTSHATKRSHACFQTGTLCSGRRSMLVLASYPSIRVRTSLSRPMSTVGPGCVGQAIATS
jgi:hypothetical protein